MNAPPIAIRATRGRLLVLAVVLLVLVGAVATSYVVSRRDDAPVAAVIPRPPADAPRYGMFVHSTVLPNGRVQVEQWIRSDQPIRRLDVRTTDPDQTLGTVVARGIRVIGDGRVLVRRREIQTQVEHLRLGRHATDVYLTYTVLGGVDMTGSVRGRVLARVLSLDVAYPGQSGPVRHRIEAPGGRVLALGCLPTTTKVNPSACGDPADRGAWEVQLVGKDRDDHVLASLDFTAAGAAD